MAREAGDALRQRTLQLSPRRSAMTEPDRRNVESRTLPPATDLLACVDLEEQIRRADRNDARGFAFTLRWNAALHIRPRAVRLRALADRISPVRCAAPGDQHR